MLRAGIILLLVALTACKREPSFDERFDAAQQKVERSARDIDAQISASDAALPDASEAAPSQ